WYFEYWNYVYDASLSGRLKWPSCRFVQGASTSNFMVEWLIDGRSWLLAPPSSSPRGFSN
ncbi:hypothetical protein Golob_018347, partial [Gossypium lobatum]|nr:hypothetical protein [Gossypium lobatum]